MSEPKLPPFSVIEEIIRNPAQHGDTDLDAIDPGDVLDALRVLYDATKDLWDLISPTPSSEPDKGAVVPGNHFWDENIQAQDDENAAKLNVSYVPTQKTAWKSGEFITIMLAYRFTWAGKSGFPVVLELTSPELIASLGGY